MLQLATVTTAQQFSSFEKTLIFHLFLFIQFFVSACILFAEGEEFERKLQLLYRVTILYEPFN